MMNYVGKIVLPEVCCGVTACEACGARLDCRLPIEARPPRRRLPRRSSRSSSPRPADPVWFMPPHRCFKCPASKDQGLRHVAPFFKETK